ncbi:MAG: hypothetical protein DRJ01_03100 [Bacteroidetes bacterium]|nr:MAG: hypothetical protein DRJ01_03100 [Bacteroidota bacterium]
MKNINKLLIIIATISIIFTSCTDVLDVEPKMELSDQTALTTTFGLQTAIIGAYDRLQSGYLYGGRIWVAGDMLAENVQKSGQSALVYEEIQMMNKNMSPDNLITSVFWSDAYATINLVNQVIAAIPVVEESGDVDIADSKNRIEGEALFIRALLHFDLVRYFGNPNTGEGVPLLTEPTGVDGKPARASIDAVYSQVIADLKRAADLLPEANNDRATSWAAKAILSRVYFFQKDYANAVIQANDVIENGGFKLADSVQQNFSSTLSDEVIFAIMSTATDASCGTLNMYYRIKSTPRFCPSNDIISYMTYGGNTDQRLLQFFTKEADGKFYTTKFDDRYMHVPVIRLAELYLTRAEAQFNINPSDTIVLHDINVIRKRADLAELSSVTSTAIYLERTKELVFEGDNFFNMKRLEKKIAGYEWNDVNLLFKIPQRERDVNPNLTQNE